MAQLAVAAMVAGTVLSAVGQVQQGNAANKAQEYDANQLDANAGEQRAASQVQAVQNRKQAALANSSLQARAAASGAGASDATTTSLSEDIDAQGEYNALTSLYNGEEKARGMEGQADMDRYAGKQAKKAATIGAISSVLTSAGSAGLKYGGGGPQANSVDAIGQQGGWSSSPYTGSQVTWNN